MSEIWFTSDTHFSHARIAEFCPQRQDWFNMDGPGDIDTMNEGLIEVWNNTVQSGDRVYHLGDFAMGKIDTSLPIISRLNGNVTLILGNHDRPHPSYSRDEKKAWDWMDKYFEAGFWEINMGGIIGMGSGRVLLCHFPYTGDSEGEDRYPEHRPHDNGLPLIHGHIHDMWQVERRMVNVGFDAWGRVLHWDEVRGLVERSLDL